MPNIASLLKIEIERVTRKELKKWLAPMKKQVAAQRRDIAALKRERDSLKREVASLRKTGRSAAPQQATEESASKLRFSSGGFRSLRKKLGVSAEEMGTLVGVSAQSVYNWEHDKSRPRPAQVAKIASLRGLGKREAAQRLTARAPAKAKGRR